MGLFDGIKRNTKPPARMPSHQRPIQENTAANSYVQGNPAMPNTQVNKPSQEAVNVPGNVPVLETTNVPGNVPVQEATNVPRSVPAERIASPVENVPAQKNVNEMPSANVEENINLASSVPAQESVNEVQSASTQENTNVAASTPAQNISAIPNSANGTVEAESTPKNEYIASTEEYAKDSEQELEADYQEEESVLKKTPIKTLAEKKPLTHAVGETKVIAIINQKGGVGKSTTAINLSAALGEQDKAVLVVDLDPQGNTTSGLGVDKGQVQHDTYDLLLGSLPAEDAIIPDVCKDLDLIPATINLAGAEVELVNEIARENRLKGALDALKGKYDYIFVDCPPALGLLTINALVAADGLLIPIQCEFYALEGVTKLLDSMKRVKNALNPTLDIFGVLLTMYDGRTTLSRQVAAEVRNFFGDTVFNSVIPRAVRLSEAPSFGQPITEYDPHGRGAQSYISLAKEVIERG